MFGLCILFLGVAHSAYCQERWAIYADAKSFSYCEPYTISGILHDLDGGLREDGDIAFTFNKVELGARKGNWQVNVFKRYDYFLDSTPDIARLYYQKERDLPLDKNYLYQGTLTASHIVADGLGVAYKWQFSKLFWFQTRLNLIYATELLDGELRGRLHTDSEGSYSSTAVVDYYYSEDILFDREVQSPTGVGVSFDLHAGFTILNNFTVEVLIEDAWSKIRWENAPHTFASGDTEAVSISDEGYLQAEAMVSGIENNVNFDQRLPPRALVDAMLHLKNSDKFLAEVFFMSSVIMPRLGYAWQFNDSGELAILYDFMAEAPALRLKFRQFNAGVIADSLNESKAHIFGLTLNYTYQF